MHVVHFWHYFDQGCHSKGLCGYYIDVVVLVWKHQWFAYSVIDNFLCGSVIVVALLVIMIDCGDQAHAAQAVPSADSQLKDYQYGNGERRSEQGESDIARNELEELRDEIKLEKYKNRVLTKQMMDHDAMQHSAMKSLINMQGLLSQFINPDVRANFLCSDFNEASNVDNILRSLDAIRDTLLPSPSCRSAGMADDSAIEFMTRLLSRDRSEPRDKWGNPLPHRLSYGEWRAYMHTLMCEWRWGPFKSESDVVRSSEQHRNGQLGGGEMKVPQVRKTSTPFLVSEQGSDASSNGSAMSIDRSTGVRPKLRSRRKDRSRKSGGRSRLPGSDGNSSSADRLDEEAGRSRNEDSIIEMLKSLRFPKEVVPPATFHPDSSVSLREFLKAYERYFEARFHGSDRDKSRQLGKFLKGAAKSAFEAMGGNSLKYAQLKPKLLEWYGSERVDGHQRSRAEFLQASMQPTDTCAIYCLRLEKLALDAFSSDLEREKQLCLKIAETAPPALVFQISSASGLLNLDGGDNLKWKHIRKLAEHYDRQQKEIMMRGTSSRSSIDPPNLAVYMGNPADSQQAASGGMPNLRGDIEQVDTMYFRRRNVELDSVNRRGSEVQRVSRCTHCRRVGHSVDKCWKKNGCCFECGAPDHYVKSCPRRNTEIAPRKGKARAINRRDAGKAAVSHAATGTAEQPKEGALCAMGDPQSLS